MGSVQRLPEGKLFQLEVVNGPCCARLVTDSITLTSISICSWSPPLSSLPLVSHKYLWVVLQPTLKEPLPWECQYCMQHSFLIKLPCGLWGSGLSGYKPFICGLWICVFWCVCYILIVTYNTTNHTCKTGYTKHIVFLSMHLEFPNACPEAVRHCDGCLTVWLNKWNHLLILVLTSYGLAWDVFNPPQMNLRLICHLRVKWQDPHHKAHKKNWGKTEAGVIKDPKSTYWWA